MPAGGAGGPAEGGAEPRGLHGEEIPGVDVLRVELPMPVRKLRIAHVGQGGHHRPPARKQLAEEETLLYAGVPALLDVAGDEAALLTLREAEIQDRLSKIVRGICHVKFGLPQAT